MHRSESLLCYSIENFLSDQEINLVIASMDAQKAAAPTEFGDIRELGRSVHSLEGFSREETVALYEPNGRIEVDKVADGATEILNHAVRRSFNDICRAFPSVKDFDPWIYVEYGAGQYITPHIDQANNDIDMSHLKVAGISIQLTDDFTGGELYIETCGSHRLWADRQGDLMTAEDADYHAQWFRDLPRTRWVSKPKKGTAFFYGSQLVHGTNPVIAGAVKKILGFVKE